MKKKAIGSIMVCFIFLTSIQISHAYDFTITNATPGIMFKMVLWSGGSGIFTWFESTVRRDFDLMPGTTHTESGLGCLTSAMPIAYPVDGGVLDPTGHGFATGLYFSGLQCWNHKVQIDNKSGVIDKQQNFEWTWW